MPDSTIKSATFVGPKNCCLLVKHKMVLRRSTKKLYSRITKIRGFNLKQSKACQVMEVKIMKNIILQKMAYWKWSMRKSKQSSSADARSLKKKKKKSKEYPKGVTLMIPQSTIITSDKFTRMNITRQWHKKYAHETACKRAYIFKTLQLMRAQGRLGQKEESIFVNCMKYFTMPFGYSESDIHLLQQKFNMLKREA